MITAAARQALSSSFVGYPVNWMDSKMLKTMAAMAITPTVAANIQLIQSLTSVFFHILRNILTQCM